MTVVTADPMRYHYSARCHTRTRGHQCVYSRNFQAAPITAESKAAKHAAMFRHKVVVTRTDMVNLISWEHIVYDNESTGNGELMF